MKYLCQYKDLLGKPGTGVHKFRIFDIAIVDLFVVLLFGGLITWILYKKGSKKVKRNIKWYLLGISMSLILLGVIVHRIFCVNTTINKLIFGEV